MSRPIACYYTNIRSLINKRDELKLLIEKSRPDVILLTETWLSSDIDDREIGLPDYAIYRQDRSNSIGGGVAILVQNRLRAFLRLDIKEATGFSEMVWCQVTTRLDKSILVGCVYRSPSAS